MTPEDKEYYDIYYYLKYDDKISKIISKHPQKNKLIRKTFLSKNIYFIANIHTIKKQIEPIMLALSNLISDMVVFLEIPPFKKRPKKRFKYSDDKYVIKDSKKFIPADIRAERKIWLTSRKDKFSVGFYKKHNTIEKLIDNLINQYRKTKRFSELYDRLSRHQQAFINFLINEIYDVFPGRTKRFYELDVIHNYMIFHGDVTAIIAYINDVALIMQIMLSETDNIAISYGRWHVYNLLDMMKKYEEFEG